MDDCDHPLDMHGMCVVCGKDLTTMIREAEQQDARMHIVHNNMAIRASREEAQRMHYESVQELLGAQKLSLVLDLDQTLLHATIDPQVESWRQDAGHRYHQLAREMHQIQTKHGPHYIKLRPGVRDFLARMHAHFELHVYTMGNREYASAIAQLLDPAGELFGERIVSRDDNVMMGERKSLRRIFPHDDRTVLVVDDRGDVWNWCPNLILISPFIYFVSESPVNTTTSTTTLTTTPTTTAYIEEKIQSLRLEELDRGLEDVANRLEFIHRQFFASTRDLLERDVKPVAAQMKQSVFRGYDLCFSGLDHNSPQARTIKQMAESFGATVHATLPDPVAPLETPGGWLLISANPQSVKSIEARDMGIPVVIVQWLWDSVYAWRALPLHHVEHRAEGEDAEGEEQFSYLWTTEDGEDSHLLRTSSFTSLNSQVLEEIDKEFENISSSDSSSSDSEDEGDDSGDDSERSQKRIKLDWDDDEDFDDFAEELENDLT